MRNALWYAGSIWSSVTRSRVHSTRAASFPKRPQYICPILRWPIPRMASRPASVSSSWAQEKIAARCGWPSGRELRSMADTETNAKAEKPAASGKPPRPEKGDKPQQAQKGHKPEKGDKPAKGDAAPRPPKARKPEERVTPRLRTHFEDVVRKKLADQFAYKNRMQVPVIEKVVINIALPRVRDFRDLSPKSFDGGGNYTIGIKEHIIFPEIDYDKVADVWGMDITVCTSAKTDDEARALLSAFNFPFRQ